MERSTLFLIETVKLLVDHPEEVQVARKMDEMGVLITLTVHSGDVGKVLGKQGSIANALRVILRSVGSREKESVHLRIHDPLREIGKQ